MSLPYYYTENSGPPQQSLDLLFHYAKQKVSSLSQASQRQDPMNNPSSLLKAFENPSIHNLSNSKSNHPTKQSLENCLQFPSYREFKPNYLKTEVQNPEVYKPDQPIFQCFDGFLRKNALIEKYNSDPKADVLMNRMQLNEFLYNQKPNNNNQDFSIDYSNIKEYKFSQTVSSPMKSHEFVAVNSNIVEIPSNRIEKTKKSQRNFLTPNRNRENPGIINEFPLNELSSTLKPDKKKKKIFDLGNLEDLKRSNLQPFSDKILDFQKKAASKGKKPCNPDLMRFYRKYRIVDKDGEDKSSVFLKHILVENTGVIFENFELKIAMKASLIDNNEKNDRNGLLILVYYCNKNKGDLKNCSLRFASSKSKVFFMGFK